jgi:cytochrome c-type biogenesis protein
MQLSLYTLILLPAALGLVGFIEPCTIGAHLIFLETQHARSKAEKMRAVMVFIAVRSLTAGIFGAFVAFLGQLMVGLQTNLWLAFGSVYLVMGVLFFFGRGGLVKRRINLAPAAWKRASSPVVLGVAFGLNIPACAAPVIFGLLGLAASLSSILAGFVMMFIFGLALSLPLIIFAAVPALAARLATLGRYLKGKTWILGLVFILLGIWSIWFGLYVDPGNWV